MNIKVYLVFRSSKLVLRDKNKFCPHKTRWDRKLFKIICLPKNPIKWGIPAKDNKVLKLRLLRDLYKNILSTDQLAE